MIVESSTNGEIVANGISAISIGVGKVFDMVLSNANAAATVPVSFTLDDASVTAQKLSSMGALNGQVLKFNGTNWVPVSLIDAQFYQGTWNPNTETIPDIGASNPGDYWVVSAAGIYPPVTGTSYAIGDWIISDDYNWTKLALSKTSVTSFNGRKGLVNLVPGDYANLKSGAKIPGSSLNDLANVDLTTAAPVNGDVLKFNGTNWIPGTAAVAVGSTEITDLSITGVDIAENTINLTKLYSPSIDPALYLRGDKTWANFTAEVLNAPLSTYVLDANTKPSVMVTDKIGPALGKIQKFLNDLNTDYISKTATAQSVSGTFSFTTPTSFLYTQLPTGASPTEVANVQYVNNYVGAAVSGLSGTAPVTLTTANGAATSGDTTLNVVSTSGYPSAGTLLVGSEAIIYTGTTATSFTGLTRGAYATTSASISNGASVNNYLFLSKSTTTVTPKMVVTGSGNVGIGTASPVAKFDVVGEVKVGETGLACSSATKGSIRYNNTTNVLEFCNGTGWNLVQAAACTDATPNAFAFTNDLMATASAVTASNILQVAGINCSISIVISGTGSPQYRTCSDATCATVVQDWTSSSASMTTGQYIQIRLTADAIGGIQRTATLYVGSSATNWLVVTAGADCVGTTPTIGARCSDGTVYAGMSSDAGGVKMFATPCDLGQIWNGTACTGTRTSTAWNNTSGGGTSTDMGNANTGRANTAALYILVDSDAPYYAAKNCEELSEAGHTDWSLPAMNELQTLWDNRTAIGNFHTINYWASTEQSTSNARALRFADNYWGGGNTKATANLVRCVRR